MISSEVQRTLVKSPPELWTELSDPEALARHLGELGEIKITRTDPENLVEWEAEGTSGTVEIEPSGWGTRVTLTVIREVPEAVEPSGEQTELAPAASSAESDGAGPQIASVSEPSAPGAATVPLEQSEEEPPVHSPSPPAEAPPVVEEAMDAEPAADQDESSLPIAHRDQSPGEEAQAAGPGASEQPPEPKPAPATEAARRAAGWPVAVEIPDVAMDGEEPAAPADADGLRAWALQSGREQELQLNTMTRVEEQPREAASPRRRGFFARLFGRRREADLEATSSDEASEESFPVGGSDEGVPALSSQEATDVQAFAALAPHDLSEPPELPETAASEAEAPEMPEAGEAEPERVVDVIAAAQTPSEAPEPDPVATHEPEAAEDTPLADDAAPAQDLAAELRAAEEVAAEEVEAVLTAVLDRLGSAHHRPFSRS